MMRLGELLVFILNRTTVGTDAQIFEGVLQLKILGSCLMLISRCRTQIKQYYRT